MKGFVGKILDINLTSGEIKKEPIDEEIAHAFLGGAGYACATLYPLINKDTDPLGPENILFFMTGPLTGTLATSTGRMVVCSKSPLTGIWGECNSGSDVCVQLKKAGYDGILIKGCSEKPVVIEIKNDEVKIKDASELWGLGIYETTRKLKESFDGKNPRVIAIGPAGEQKVKYAIIGSEERAFGRTGLGAVMGSKKIKAIIVSGNGKIPVADSEKLKEQTKETNKLLMEVFTNEMMQELGTSGGMDMYNVNGELPVKYYRGSDFEETDNISGATLSETYLKKNRHCYACPIGCGRVVKVSDEEAEKFELPSEEFEGPEYETLASYGSLMLNGELIKVIKANYLCNDLGFDTIESGSIIALLMDNFEKGKITAEQLDGLELNWGNIDGAFALLKKITKRDGIGDILAEGVSKITEFFNIDPEQVAAIKNSHLTLHDMRASNGMAIAYGISPHYGGSHNACDMYMVSTGLEIEDMGIESIDAKDNSPKMAQMSAKVMEYRAFYSSAIFCVFANPSGEEIAKYLEAVIGEPFDKEKIKEYGERILTIKRLFNLKMGHTPKDEHIPSILLQPLPESGQEGNVPNIDLLFSEFYKYEEWDPETGYPSNEKLERLNLIDYKK